MVVAQRHACPSWRLDFQLRLALQVAWYLHLKFKSWSIVKAIFISWSIAFFEYTLQVPANRCVRCQPFGCGPHLRRQPCPTQKLRMLQAGPRCLSGRPMLPCDLTSPCRIGHFTGGGPFTAPQLKTVQEFLRWAGTGPQPPIAGYALYAREHRPAGCL